MEPRHEQIARIALAAGAADIAKVTTANLVEEAVTWGIRRRAASAVVTETLDRVLAAIPATSGDDRVLAAIRRQAERISAASG
jgi:serine/threonine-protein kinase HipA